jgi:glycosyltransferase involved in cell wall biosynthesis
MKVLHVPYGFYPEAVGGTEVYVEALSRELQSQGVETIIAAPGDANTAYDYHGIPVRRYKVQPPQDLRDLYSEGDPETARSFGAILSREKPDIVHLHALSGGASLGAVRAAKAYDSKAIFTYHTPTVTCQRGTMMKWGVESCQGIMDLHTCSRCTLQGLLRPTFHARAAKSLAHVVGSMSPGVGSLLGWLNLRGGAWTALRMTELLRLRHQTVTSLFAEVDQVVAVCEWVQDVLLHNGVTRDKITLCRQGVYETALQNGSDSKYVKRNSCLTVTFLGRFDRTKGIDILIHAMRRIPDARLQLHIYGMAQGEFGREYERSLRTLTGSDNRIEFHAPVPVSQVASILRQCDVLAVPSQWLETGPLVVLEAFAAKVPVLGSRLGGITELVRDGFDGILVDPSNIDEWAATLKRLTQDPSLVERLRTNVRVPRTMANVAEDMLKIYNNARDVRSVYKPCRLSPVTAQL